MARYSTFKYGQAKYGTSPTTSSLLWTFIVKWNDYWYQEGTRMTDLTVTRGKDHAVGLSGDGLTKYSPGRATLILDNEDGRYDPFNTSSPLYPDVFPGKFVELKVKNGNTGTNYSIMEGLITDIQPFYERRKKRVRIDVIDGLDWIQNKTVNISLQEPGDGDVTTADPHAKRMANLVLLACDWPDSEWPRDYEVKDHDDPPFPSDDTALVPYFSVWQKNALEAIRELETAEMGAFFHGKDGTVKFIGSSFDRDSTIEIDQEEILTDVNIPQPWETLRNRVEVRVNPVIFHDFSFPELLWQLEDPVRLLSGQTWTTDVIFRYGAYQPVYPANVGDIFFGSTFKVWTNADGTGTELTLNCSGTVTAGDEVGTYGEGVTITVTNNSTFDGYITNLQIFGDAFYATYSNIIPTEDSVSIARVGSRVLKIESPWIQTNDRALAMAEYLINNYKDAIPYPTIQIEQRPELQYAPDLYVDVIDLSIPTLNISREYRISKIEHRWLKENGQAVRTTFKLEPYFTPFGS